MSTLQITRKMASMRESSSDVFVNLSDQLGGLVLKEEQKLAVEALSRKRCNGRSSHWFREIQISSGNLKKLSNFGQVAMYSHPSFALEGLLLTKLDHYLDL